MVHAVIPAAGRGERMGGKVKKQFLTLCGHPVIVHTLTIFEGSPSVDEIVCVVARGDIPFLEHLVLDIPLTKVKRVVAGGERRQDSVAAGLALLEENDPDDIVLVHDGVRPMVTASLIEKVVRAAEKGGGAVAALPVADSLKQVSEKKVIEKSIPRKNIWLMQTPQAFRLGLLVEAYRKAAKERFWGTDEAALVERLGFPIQCIEGSTENIKITAPSDLKMAEFLLRERNGRPSA